MVLFTVLSRASCIKQSIFCNSSIIMYKISDIRETSKISPRVPVQFNIITTEDELTKYEGYSEIRKYLWKFKYFIDKGCQLYLAFVAGNLAGYYLVADLKKYKPYLYNNHLLFQADSSYFIFYCRTFEKFRRNGIYTYMLTNMCRNLLPKPGSVFISTDLDNVFSQNGIEKTGFKKIGSLKYIQLFQFVLFSKLVDVGGPNVSQHSIEVL